MHLEPPLMTMARLVDAVEERNQNQEQQTRRQEQQKTSCILQCHLCYKGS